MRVVTGQAKGVRLKAARRPSLRPTSSLVRGAIFAVLGPEQVLDARVLDLYAGTGALGIEALSRGAAWADFVERDARLAEQLRENLAAAGFAERGHVYCATVQKALGFLAEPYGLVLLDPPYGAAGLDRTLALLGAGRLLAPGAMAVAEHAWRAGPATGAAGLTLLETRRYGDTAVSFYEYQGGLHGR